MAINFLSGIDINNGVLYTDTTNNRVGIGTTSPEHSLHVVSSEQCPALFESEITGGGIALMDSTTTDDQQVGIGAFGDHLCFRSGGAAAGNMRLLSNGNLGIGTTSPAAKLDVNGNTKITGTLDLNDGSNRVIIGTVAGGSGTNQTCVGVQAGRSSSANAQSVFGYECGELNSGNAQSAFGMTAGQLNVSNNQSVFGYGSGRSNSGANQTAVGYFAGRENSGVNQSALGYEAGRGNSGIVQSSFGCEAGRFNSGDFQTAVGYFSGKDNSGANQTAVGSLAGRDNSGANQTALGYEAGRGNSGNNIITIGFESSEGNSGDNVVAIGYQAGKDNTTDNQFIVEQRNVNTTPLIQGDFSTGNVAIGTTTPAAKLHVNGNEYIEGKTIYKNPAGNSIQGYVANEFYYTPGHVLNSWGTLRSSSSNALFYGVTPDPNTSGVYLSSANNVSWSRSSLESGNAFEYKSIGPTSVPVGDPVSLISRFKIDNSTGNVGIGTTSPEAKLNITGSVNQDDTKLYLTENAGTGSYFKYNGDTNVGEIGGIESSVERPSIRFPRNGSTLSLYTSATERLTINSSGNVGIGTTAPAAKLHVNGSARFDTNTGTTPFYITRQGSTTESLSIKVLDNNVVFESIQDESVDNYGGFDFRMDGGSSQPDFVVRKNEGDPILNVRGDGRVGMGTTSPSDKLTIQTSAGSLNGLTLKDSGGNDAAKFNINPTTGEIKIGSSRVNYFPTFYSNNSEAMRINTAGNVGVGTTSPGEKLHVDGNEYIEGKTIYKNPAGNSIQGYVANEFYYTPGHVLNSWGTLRSSSNNALFYGVTPDPNTSGVYLSSANNVSWSRSSLESGNAFEYKSIGPTSVPVGDPVSLISRFKIDNSTGNVGIGATNPATKLDVNGDLKVRDSIFIPNSINDSNFEISNIGPVGGSSLNLNNFANILDPDFFDAAIQSLGDIELAGSNTQMLKSNDGSFLASYNPNTYNFGFANNAFQSNPVSGTISLSPIGATLMQLDGLNSRVGIGTTSPASKLEVSGDKVTINNTDDNGLFLNKTGGSNWNYIDFIKDGVRHGYTGFDSGSNYRINTSFNGTNIVLQAGNTEILRASSNGNVGIGITNPAHKLDVNGNINSVGSGKIGFNIQDAYSSGNIARYGISRVGNVITTSGWDGLNFATRDNTRLTVANNGNIGIGNASPTYKLDVTGDGRTTGDFRANSFITTSDSRLKRNIRDISSTRVPLAYKEFELLNDEPGKKRYGILADDIAQDHPELVHYNENNEMGVDYTSLLIKKIAELEASAKETLSVQWRHYIGDTRMVTLYDTGATAVFPYAYGGIPVYKDMYLDNVMIANNPYSSKNRGPEGGRASVLVYVNNRLMGRRDDIEYNNEAFASVIADFGQSVRVPKGSVVHIRFQADGAWWYCNSTIVLKEA